MYSTELISAIAGVSDSNANERHKQEYERVTGVK